MKDFLKQRKFEFFRKLQEACEKETTGFKDIYNREREKYFFFICWNNLLFIFYFGNDNIDNNDDDKRIITVILVIIIIITISLLSLFYTKTILLLFSLQKQFSSATEMRGLQILSIRT